ncbi:hypothetical protein CMUS01_05327 [Colletotrichum musicola]|uniref:Mid2 domain-containing protein n=1 Tax=Colletotrichum musicola TaxID=2175873 RepID=A0A8H6KSQ1_9PEZI|nr:hypothetical protein CMUS01_05327 [Colletotrichum musicola]
MIALRPWALCLLLGLPDAMAICYFPDGSVAADTPCQDGTDASVCCGSGYACLANGMCKATGKELQKSDATIFVRGSCTDKTWRSSKCPLFCIDQNNGGGAGVMQCQNTLEDLFYCAGLDPSQVDCSANKGVLFFQQSATAYTTIGIEATSTAATTTAEGATGPTTSRTSSSATSTEDLPNPLPSDQTSNSATIGIAVGVTLGVILLGTLGVFAYFLIRKWKREATVNELHRNDHPPPAIQPSSDTYKTGPSQPYVPQPANQIYEAPGEPKSTYVVPQELPVGR